MEIENIFIKKAFIKREKDSHKGDYGRVLVIAGSRGMSGACVLCANAALASGAGLVYAAFLESQENSIVARLRPEAMTYPVEESASGGYAPNAANDILKFAEFKKISACVIGPGMGNDENTQKFIKQFINRSSFPVVVDADALNALSKDDAFTEIISSKKGALILTPHLGEFARFFKKDCETVNGEKDSLSRQFAVTNNAILVLKGYKTIITDGINTFVNPTGNPGMAKGGSGDVLAGMTAAFIAQMNKPQLLNAAISAVYLHGLAGDIAVREKGEIALLPSDLIEALPKAWINIWS